LHLVCDFDLVQWVLLSLTFCLSIWLPRKGRTRAHSALLSDHISCVLHSCYGLIDRRIVLVPPWIEFCSFEQSVYSNRW
jgi:hypothetical protein